MRVAVAIELSDEERRTLRKWSRGRSTPARLVNRAKIVMLAADGWENKDIAIEVGCIDISHEAGVSCVDQRRVGR